MVPLEEERWYAPFRLEGDPFGTSIPVPERVRRVTENARRGLEVSSQPDQVAPGFFGLGPALLVRNLALAYLGRPPLILYTTDPTLTLAYHALKDPIMGRWAVRFPMYYLWEGKTPRPVNRRGMSRTNLPEPVLLRANSLQDLNLWLQKVPLAKTLFVVGGPKEVPPNRPRESHVVLQGVVGGRDEEIHRLRRPCILALPSEPPPYVSSRRTLSMYDAFAIREWNAAHGTITLRVVDGPEDYLGRMAQAYRVLVMQSWDRWGGFLGICRTVYHRLQSDALPSTDPAPKEAGVSTESLLHVLQHTVQLGEAPPVPEARSFVELGRAVVALRKTHVSGKGTWVETHEEFFAEPPAPALLVDGGYTQARWAALQQSTWAARPHIQTVPLGARRQLPLASPSVVTAAPSAKLLSDLVSGATPASTLLLYPWEIPDYALALSHLRTQARRLGIKGWPSAPEPPDATEWQPKDTVEFVPHPRTFDWSDPEDDEGGGEDLPALAGTGDEGTAVLLTTSEGSYRLPADRQVIVIRQKAYHEMQACDARPGDVVVVPMGIKDPSANMVIERLCRRNPVMNRTRAMAGMWRDLLKQYISKKFPGQAVAKVHREMRPAVTVTYPEFLHWLRDGEPITPTRQNLVRLASHLDFGDDLAIMIYEEGLHHKKDRRDLLRYVLDLANSRLDDIYEKALRDSKLEENLSLSVEDLMAVIRFESVQAVKVVHASG